MHDISTADLKTLDKPLILCHTNSMKTNDSTMTFRYALSVLEAEFNSTYRGIKTVSEMCSSLTDWISWEGESPDAIYHVFEIDGDPDRLVADEQVIALAKHYA